MKSSISSLALDGDYFQTGERRGIFLVGRIPVLTEEVVVQLPTGKGVFHRRAVHVRGR